MTKCEECDEKEATIYCTNCDTHYQCEDCSTDVHSHKKRKDHIKYTTEEWSQKNKEENMEKGDQKIVN
jgi:hypothetical protein